jgi:triphosphatase
VPALRLALDKACAKTVPESSLVTSTYYDSPDLKLRQQSLSLHLQEQNGCRVQVVKGIGSAAARRGMVDGEWQDPIAADRPDFAAPETGPRLGVVVGEALRPLFKTQIRRTLFKFDLDPSVEIAAALDEGEVSAADGDAAEPVCELQLDLNHGDPVFLYDMRCGCSTLRRSGWRRRVGPSAATDCPERSLKRSRPNRSRLSRS